MQAELKKAFVGQNLVLTADNTTNFSALKAWLSGKENCKASVEYERIVTAATAIIFENEVLVSFESSVVYPAGVCVEFDCQTEEEDLSGCKNVQKTLTSTTRLAVLDERGCLAGYITLGDLVNKPTKLCDVTGTIGQGRLTASDRILTIDANCGLKSVAASDIVCK